MTNLLLIFCFVLNIIALLSIMILYLRQNRFTELEKRQQRLLAEIEEVVSSYLVEMNEENEKFLQKLRAVMEKGNLSTSMLKEEKDLKGFEGSKGETVSDETLEKNEDQKGKGLQETEPKFRRGNHFQAVNAYKSIIQKEKQEAPEEVSNADTSPSRQEDKKESSHDEGKKSDLYMQSFYYQVVLLRKQGLSIEDIARRLHKGKTEIELLLKLHQKEE